MQIRNIALALVALAAGTTADAQERPRVRVQRDTTIVLDRGGPERSMERVMRRAQGMALSLPRRQRLGVMVDLSAQDDDKYGATIDGVTPGGPAARAGLRAGDVITALDGKSLTSGETPKDAGEDQSLPGLRLIELAAKLGANDTVTVAYRRGGESKTARLITGDDAQDMVFFRNGGPDGDVRTFSFRMPPGGRLEPGMMPRGLAEMSPDRIENIEIRRDGNGPARIMMNVRGALGELELAPLNADLGRYFGTSEGVLVLNTPKQPGLGLKGGDVVTAIDGRKVNGPSQLLRILRSYEPGEAVKFEIQRDKRRETVSGKVPERGEVGWRVDDGGL